MSSKIKVALLALSLGLAPIAAIAQQAASDAAATGTATTTSSTQGSVIVIRGGQEFSLGEGDALLEGDTVVTAPQSSSFGPGTATLTFNGCSVSLSPGQQVDVSSAFCNAGFTPTTVSSPIFAGLTTAPVALGAAAVIAGVVAVSNDDDDDNRPVSPG